MKTKTKEPWELWCEALESGEYERTICNLCRKVKSSRTLKYCCLGVACEVYRKKNPGELEKVWSYDRDYVSYDNVSEFLPWCVVNWLGLSSRDGKYFDEKGESRSLADDNDSYNMPFKTIAEIIRSKPKGLFANKGETNEQEE